MKKTNFRDSWLSSGYELFAQEGPDGIQVERLARILNLNKSDFYHYFGEIENFLLELMILQHSNGKRLHNEMNSALIGVRVHRF
jgi:AcrR family transcriptional regulator